MPEKSPPISDVTAALLQVLGSRVAEKRKALRLSASVTAEAAGMSRVTLHRIEKGEPSVTMGAWSNAIGALGMHLQLQEVAPRPVQADRTGWWPVHIALSDYPQLKALAWQVQGTDHLTPVEAFDIYERNARHMDKSAMTQQELALWDALQQAFGKRSAHV